MRSSTRGCDPSVEVASSRLGALAAHGPNDDYADRVEARSRWNDELAALRK